MAGHAKVSDTTTRLVFPVAMNTGCGSSIGAVRVVRRQLEAGVAAAQIKDQVLPRRCSHLDGPDTHRERPPRRPRSSAALGTGHAGFFRGERSSLLSPTYPIGTTPGQDTHRSWAKAPP